MTKKLKELAELYKPKAKGEQNFVKKHVTVKHKDRNGNGDDVFNATKIKSIDKSPEHGYNAGEDEAVYEETTHKGSYDEWKKKLPNHTSYIDSTEHESQSHAYKRVGPKRDKVKIGTYYHKAGYGTLKEGVIGNAIHNTKQLVKGAKGLWPVKGGSFHKPAFKSDPKKIEEPEKIRVKDRNGNIVESEVLAELSKAAVKRYKGAALDNLNYHSKQWDRLAKLHSFSLGQEKAFDKHDKEAEKRYSGINKANKKLGLPGHNLKEEILDELSKSTLGSYVKKASKDNVYAAASNAKGWGKKADRRQKYINKAIDNITKEDVDLQELSKKTLASYINKAAVKNLAHAGSLATQAHDEDKDKRDEAGKTAKKLVNKLDGIHRATKRLAKEEVEQIDELSKIKLRAYQKAAIDDAVKHQPSAAIGINYAKQRVIKRNNGEDLADRKIYNSDMLGNNKPKVPATGKRLKSW